MKTLRVQIPRYFLTILIMGAITRHAGFAAERTPLVDFVPSVSQQAIPLELGDLISKAERDGTICVLVEFNDPIRLERSPEKIKDLKQQRQVISTIQDKVLQDLTGFNVSSVKRFRTVQFISMEVDIEALRALSNLPETVVIKKDCKVPPFKSPIFFGKGERCRCHGYRRR